MTKDIIKLALVKNIISIYF